MRPPVLRQKAIPPLELVRTIKQTFNQFTILSSQSIDADRHLPRRIKLDVEFPEYMREADVQFRPGQTRQKSDLQ